MTLYEEIKTIYEETKLEYAKFVGTDEERIAHYKTILSRGYQHYIPEILSRDTIRRWYAFTYDPINYSEVRKIREFVAQQDPAITEHVIEDKFDNDGLRSGVLPNLFGVFNYCPKYARR
jgi:hypothetical protein